jgi:hypothetical protein
MASTATGTAADERTRRTQIVKAAETSLAQLGEQRFEMKQVAPARLPAEDLSLPRSPKNRQEASYPVSVARAPMVSLANI